MAASSAKPMAMVWRAMAVTESLGMTMTVPITATKVAKPAPPSTTGDVDMLATNRGRVLEQFPQFWEDGQQIGSTGFHQNKYVGVLNCKCKKRLNFGKCDTGFLCLAQKSTGSNFAQEPFILDLLQEVLHCNIVSNSINFA